MFFLLRLPPWICSVGYGVNLCYSVSTFFYFCITYIAHGVACNDGAWLVEIQKINNCSITFVSVFNFYPFDFSSSTLSLALLCQSVGYNVLFVHFSIRF